jgi:ABC-type nitrate/sulfonate/bicarbonate transport system substrate-binding protein
MVEKKSNSRMKMVAVVAVVVVVVAAAAMALIVSTPTSGGSMDITITYSNKVDYEPLIVAKALDYFHDEGLNATLLIVSGGIQSAEALATGSADLGAMGDAPGVTLMAQTVGVKLVASYGGGEGMHRLIGWRDVQNVTDLAGKRVGVQIGSSSQCALLRLLDKWGIDAGNVTQVPLSPSDMPTALRTRQVDAIMASEPWPTNSEIACGDDVHEIANSTGLGSSYPLVMMASQKLVTEKPAAITAALRAIDRAITYMQTDPESAMAICSNKTGLSVANEQKCLASLTYNLSLGPKVVDDLNSTAQFLLESGKIPSMPDIAACTDVSYLEAMRA